MDRATQYLWQSYWHPAVHRSELPDEGDYLRLHCLGRDVVVRNEGAGDLIAMENRCMHRGARILSGDHGNAAMTCPYHGWTYRSGQLVTPIETQFPGCRREEIHLSRYQTAWCGDFLFLSEQPVRPLEAQLGSVFDDLADRSFVISGRADFNRYPYECDWRIVVENALEPDHIGLIHPQSLGKLRLGDGENVFIGENSIWRAPVTESRTAGQLGRLTRYFDIGNSYRGYESFFIFPFSMLSSTFGLSFSLQSFFPAGVEGETCFTSRLLKGVQLEGAPAGVADSLLSSTAQLNRQVFAEDHEICKRVVPGAWSDEPLRFASLQEIKIQHFRESHRAARALARA